MTLVMTQAPMSSFDGAADDASQQFVPYGLDPLECDNHADSSVHVLAVAVAAK
jgi:hypothetical protein